ncbi:MAG: peptidoglycan DD-metalloendopeptidase family protein [Aquimonas sp.]|nr:peptidoglycan DD-metalloendopeptidase family protein [Aquimonas sp.]
MTAAAALRGLLVALLLPALAQAQAQDPAAEREAERRLSAVRVQINEISRVQQALAAERDAAGTQLREVDQAIAAQSARVAELEADSVRQQARLDALLADRDALAAQLGRQREALAALLRAAHAQGGQAPLRLLLGQDRLSDASRALAYHRYVQRGQVQRIQRLLDELADLARLGELVVAQRAVLDEALLGEQEAMASLESRRADRAALLEVLAGQQRAQAAQMAELRADERALLDLLDSLRDIFADIPESPDGAASFAEQRGRLPVPLVGRVLSGFGGNLPDGRRSEGWLVEAAAGAPVRAVAHGRVAFADWMNGYGLLVIVDHGDGYLSLYAHSDSLLSEVGDWVRPGDTLAHAGSSGGQGRPALYFELRRQRQPLDPRVWLRP